MCCVSLMQRGSKTYDKVTLALLVLHLLLESGAEGVEGVSAGGDVGIGEDADCDPRLAISSTTCRDQWMCQVV